MEINEGLGQPPGLSKGKTPWTTADTRVNECEMESTNVNVKAYVHEKTFQIKADCKN